MPRKKVVARVCVAHYEEGRGYHCHAPRGPEGTSRGASAIREDRIEQWEKANEEFFSGAGGDPEADFLWIAGRLVGAVESEKRALCEGIDTLSRIIRWEGH